MTTVGRVGEWKLLAGLLPRLAPLTRGLVLGPGDDGAIVSIGGEHWVLTTDMLVENVHFRRKWSPGADLGHKSLAVNLSDLAAMGDVAPRYALVAAGLPPQTRLDWVRDFYRGFRALGSRHGLTVAGGDTVRADRLTISVALLGRLRNKARVFRRDAARPGDRLLVTGTLGDALAGLRILERGGGAGNDWLVRRFRRPTPRLDWARQLAAQGVVAGMDISDGFWRSLRILCEASGTGARVEADRLPISPALRRWSPRPAELALAGGEDYELMVAARPQAAKKLAGLPWLTDVGEIRPRHAGLEIFESGKKRKAPPGYEHFNV